jgi:hypothetical protein
MKNRFNPINGKDKPIHSASEIQCKTTKWPSIEKLLSIEVYRADVITRRFRDFVTTVASSSLHSLHSFSVTVEASPALYDPGVFSL